MNKRIKNTWAAINSQTYFLSLAQSISGCFGLPLTEHWPGVQKAAIVCSAIPSFRFPPVASPPILFPAFSGANLDSLFFFVYYPHFFFHFFSSGNIKRDISRRSGYWKCSRSFLESL